MILVTVTYICEEPGCDRFTTESQESFIYSDVDVFIPEGWTSAGDGRIKDRLRCDTCSKKIFGSDDKREPGL